MFAIGCATSDERAFRAAAAHTIESFDEGSALLMRRHRYDTIDVPYNEMLDAAISHEGLEGVVLVDQSTRLEASWQVLAHIGLLMVANPQVAVVGSVDHGLTRELDVIDGTLIALSPWAARALRFDPVLGGSLDALAYDISLQARAAGRSVAGIPLGAFRAVMPLDRTIRARHQRTMVALRRKWVNR